MQYQSKIPINLVASYVVHILYLVFFYPSIFFQWDIYNINMLKHVNSVHVNCMHVNTLIVENSRSYKFGNQSVLL